MTTNIPAAPDGVHVYLNLNEGMLRIVSPKASILPKAFVAACHRCAGENGVGIAFTEK